MVRYNREFEDGVEVSKTPFTMIEELYADARQYYLQLMKDLVDAPPWPQDITEWRARMDPMRAAERYIERKGYDPDNVPQDTKMAVALIIEVALAAAVFFHGTDWEKLFKTGVP